MSGRACGACGTAADADARFCEGCGAALERSCGACGVAASPTARFCRACGAPLETSGASAGPTRKTVTVMFADLAGSTAFEEAVDAETAREVVGQYHELLRSTAHRHRAGVTKYIGDGFMAVWGVPEVGADDAGHAVDAAVDLQERFVDLADRVAQGYGVTLALRVAVNTGEVVVGADDADLVGDALNVGARLESECPHGHVVVGEETWRSTRGRHRYEPRGAVQVKGRTAPVNVYQWLGHQAETASIPFVGRATEIGRLRTIFDDAVATRTARLVTVTGDPGVGKTRLATEFAAALDTRVLQVRCAVEGAPALAPVVDELRSRDLDADIADHVADRDRMLRDLKGMTAGVPGSVEETFWALRRFVEVLAFQRALVIVVDDIQWADGLLLDFVTHLAEWVRDAPVLLVALARPELRETRPDLVTVGGWVADALHVRGLEASATAELAARVLGSERLPADLLGRLPASTGGNPLFVRELVGMLVHDGVLVAGPDGWRLTVDADAISVPPTIQALLSSRLERLAPADRRVLEVASVVGTDFSPGAVSALAGPGAADVTAALSRLRRLDLAQPSGAYAGDEPVWRFHHVLIRDVAYRRLLKSDRAELHERLADWVSAAGAGAGSDSEEAIARHLEAAYGYRRDLGVRDGTDELGLRSARHYLTSARRALDRDELVAAGTQAARGAALAATDTALRAELLSVGCEAFLSAGDVAAGAPLVEDLESIAGEALSAWATCYRCQLLVYTEPSRLPEVDELLQGAIDDFAGRGEAAGLAKAHRVRAGARARLGRIGDCEADLFEALIAARRGGDHRQITAALGAAPNAALWGPSPAPKAGGRCLDVVRMQRMTTAAPSLEATSLRCLAVLELLRGRPDKARSMLADARQVVADLGLRHGLMETELFAGIIELMVGDPVAAEPHFRTALEGLDALGVGADAGQAAALLARSVLAQGRIDEADRHAAESERVAGHNLKTAIAWRAVRAEILSAQGRHDAAVALAREATAVAAGTDLVLDHADACLALGRVLAAAGDQRAAATARAEAEKLYAAKDAIFLVENAAAETVSAPPRPAPARLAVSTRASRTIETVGRGLDSRDPDAVVAVFSNRVVVEDRRRLSGDPVEGLHGVRTAVQRLMAQYSHIEWQVQAVRGESLTLVWGRWSDESGNEGASFDVFEVDDDGLVDYHGRFDPDDFEGAYRELERRYYAGEGAPFAENGHKTCAWLEAMWRRDVDAAREVVWPDFRWRASPSALKPVERSVEQFFEWLDERTQQVPALRVWSATMRWLSPNCYVALAEISGEEYRWNRIYVGEYRDGLGASVREFDVEDEDAAFAYAESLVAPRPARLAVTNRASRVTHQVFNAMRDNDAHAATAFLARNVIYEDRRQLAGGLVTNIDHLAAAFSVVLGQYNHFEDSTLAVRGEQLCLDRTVWSDDTGNEVTNLHVTELGEDGLIAYECSFDGDDFWAAYREMENRYYAGEGARFAANGLPSADWVMGISRGDFEAVRRASHPDFRWYAPPDALKDAERSVDDMFAWMQERGRQVTSQRHWVPVLRWLSPTCGVGLGEICAVGADGEEFRWNFVYVGECRDGLLASVHEFDVDDEDGAFAYAESVVADRSSRLPTTNRAADVGRRVIAAVQRGAVDDAVAEYSDDVVYDDRRRLSGEPIVGLGAVRAGFERLRAQYSRFAVRTLAVYGENLHFAESTWSDEAGNRSIVLLVAELDDHGRVRYHGTFDEDDFENAYREFQRRYYTGDGAPYALHGAALTELAVAESRGDLDEVFTMFGTPGLRIESRSRSLFPSRSPAELRRSLEELGAMVGSYRVWASACCWLPGDWLVSRHHREAVGPDGERYEWVRLYVVQIQDGRFTSVCEFDVDDEDAAFTYAQEQVRGSSRLAVANRASGVGDRILRAMQARDVDAAVAHWADQFVYDDRRRLSGGPLSDHRGMRAAIARIVEQYNTFDSRVLAVRGDTLSLAWHRWADADGNETRTFILAEIGDDGRVAYEARFDDDDFDAAYRELEQRYYAGEGAGYAESGSRGTEYILARNRGDLDTAFNKFTWPDVRVQSRSQSVFVERSAAEYRASLEGLLGLVGSFREWLSALQWVSPHCSVALMQREATGQDGEQFEWTRIVVCEIRGGRLASVCDFDVDDEDAAFAHAEQCARDADLLALTNRASQVGDRIIAAMRAKDVEAAVHCWTEQFVYDDRRRLSGGGMSDRGDMRRTLDLVVRQYDTFDCRILAVRGETLTLAWHRWSNGDGDETSCLNLGEMGDDGRGCYQARFDDDDFDAAYRELEQRYYAGEGAAFADGGFFTAEFVTAMNRSDFDTMFGRLSWPDLRVHNRSRSGFPDRSAAELRASLEELDAMVGSVRSWFSAVQWLTPSLWIGRLEREGRGRDGEQYTWARILVCELRAGRLASIGDFDAEDQDAAFAYAHEAISARLPSLDVD